MKFKIIGLFILCWIFLIPFNCLAQHKNSNTNPVYADKQGVLRQTKDNTEAAFFGVNYTVPFAYGYRSHQALNTDLEKAIDNDVYHFARLGLDAFRVHVWDTEITDSLGNLLENEHLRLFDYLLYKLKQRNIKILITPIAFWGNGYPEKDEKTQGFSSIYNKQQALVTEAAIKAQENYLQQFFKHINPYTKRTYVADPDVIAMEINNEPHHSRPKEKVTEYINRMVKAVKSTGWAKPVFYNISESPAYADAVAKADVDGHSFQWYPTGLVANHTLHGNFLPNVDQYYIPFTDTIPQFRNRAKMVYEFDAGDILQSNMYPAMARSFRAAGFQWATQFAYDPMATAYANTEYQTHYLNLVYTPAKAISLLIAAKAFHQLPRLKNYGTYPADSVFDAFRVSYKNDLSEMNTDTAFYYSNTTTTKPRAIAKLKHIAGVGSSAAVNYAGYGAYFLDKVADGIWRLEVMPDAIYIGDPFEKASPQKEVTRIQWQRQCMQINLPNLGTVFTIKPVNEGNDYTDSTNNGSFRIKPGTYIVQSQKVQPQKKSEYTTGTISLREFVAPKPISDNPFVKHIPYTEVSAAKPFFVAAKIVGVDTADKIVVEVRTTSNLWKTIIMKATTAYDYIAQIPADIVTPGLINYRIIIQKKNGEYYTFPGNHKGNPYAWHYINNNTWQTFVAVANAPLTLFDSNTDRSTLTIYNPDWRHNTITYITADNPHQLVLKATMNKPSGKQIMGWQLYFADKLQGRLSDISSFNHLVIKARMDDAEGWKAKVTIINKDGQAFAAYVSVNNQWQDIKIPLQLLQPDSALLLPRPYPGFQPLWFKAATKGIFDIAEAEKLQITFGSDMSLNQQSKPISLEVETIYLER